MILQCNLEVNDYIEFRISILGQHKAVSKSEVPTWDNLREENDYDYHHDQVNLPPSKEVRAKV